MKKIITVLLSGLILFGISSCKKTKEKVEELTEFDINYTNTLTVPSSSITVNVPADFNTPEIPTDSKNKFVSQKTTQNLIDEIKMTKFNLSVSNGNLDFLKSLSIYLKTSNLGDILIATKSNIPAGVSSIAADLKDVNIKEYIFQDKIQFRVNITIQTSMTATQQLKMDQTVHVKGKVSN